MTQLEALGVWTAPLQRFSATFDRGINVVIGSARDGAPELIELCAGARLPRRGSVRFGGVPPSRSPEVRRVIASLFAAELSGAGADVGGWLDEIARIKAFDTRSSARRYCPSIPSNSALAALSSVERRQLALSVALGQPDSELVALYDPLSLLATPIAERALERIRELGERATVIVTTASRWDAKRLGGVFRVLDRGLLSPNEVGPWPRELTRDTAVEMWIDTDRARELLRRLIDDPNVESACVEAAPSGRLRITGRDVESLARAVAGAALAVPLEIRAMQTAPLTAAALKNAAPRSAPSRGGDARSSE